MKTMILALTAATAVVAAETNEVRLPSLTIGTNTYKKVVLKRRNALEAIVRFDGGITKVKIAELPEPYRTKWHDEDAARELEDAIAERVKDGKESNQAANAARNAASIRANYRAIEGRLIPRSAFKEAEGRVVRQINGGLLLQEPRYSRVPTGRRFGPFNTRSEYASVEIPGAGTYRYVRNAPNKATGEYARLRAHSLGKTISIGGVTAELWDCGVVPTIRPEKVERDLNAKK